MFFLEIYLKQTMICLKGSCSDQSRGGMTPLWIVLFVENTCLTMSLKVDPLLYLGFVTYFYACRGFILNGFWDIVLIFHGFFIIFSTTHIHHGFIYIGRRFQKWWKIWISWNFDSKFHENSKFWDFENFADFRFFRWFSMISMVFPLTTLIPLI